MRRVFLLICVLAFAGTAFAGFSIGFKQTPVPTYVNINETTGYSSLQTEDVYMLRIGFMASPDFRLEGLIGYGSEHYELTNIKYDGNVMAFGAGGYYIIAAPANTSFSIGAQFLYGKSSNEVGIGLVTVDGPETTSWSLDPLMRVDFAIPGAERLAFFTEYGIRYASATTTITTGTTSVDHKWSGWQTYAPPNILAGAYYVF